MVFTDMVGSTQMKQCLGDLQAMRLIHQHHSLVRDLLKSIPGATEIGTSGDSFFLAFKTPSDAVQFAVRFQSGLRKLRITVGYCLQDRVGIHVGEVYRHLQEGTEQLSDLNGIQVDTCARVMSLAGADQILMTRFAFDNAQQMLKSAIIDGVAGSLVWAVHGLYQLKGVANPVEICEVAEHGASKLEAPGSSEKAHRLNPVGGGFPISEEQAAEIRALADRTLKHKFGSATKRERHHALLGAILVSVAGSGLLFSSLLDDLSLDLSFFPRRSATARLYTNDVEFIVMDNESMVRLGQSSLREWNRKLHADLINRMAAARARAVAFDIVFQTNRPSEDAAFLTAVRKFGKVAVAVAQNQEIRNGIPMTITYMPFDQLRTNAWCGLTESADSANITIRQPRFGRASSESIIRWNSLAEELVARVDAKKPFIPSYAWLNYYCPPNRIPYRPYWEVLAGNIPPPVFSNKVVFVGSKFDTRNPDEPGSDQFRTPLSLWGFSHAPGVVINATSYLNLKREDWFSRSPLLEFLLALLIGIGGSYLLAFTTPVKTVIVGAATATGLAALALILPGACHFWFCWVIPCFIQIPIAAIWSIVTQVQRAAEDKRVLLAALSSSRINAMKAPT